MALARDPSTAGARCPECGGTVAMVIDPNPKTHLTPVGQIACVGQTSCGWSMGLQVDLATLEQIAEQMREGLAA